MLGPETVPIRDQHKVGQLGPGTCTNALYQMLSCGFLDRQGQRSEEALFVMPEVPWLGTRPLSWLQYP